MIVTIVNVFVSRLCLRREQLLHFLRIVYTDLLLYIQLLQFLCWRIVNQLQKGVCQFDPEGLCHSFFTSLYLLLSVYSESDMIPSERFVMLHRCRKFSLVCAKLLSAQLHADTQFHRPLAIPQFHRSLVLYYTLSYNYSHLAPRVAQLRLLWKVVKSR